MSTARSLADIARGDDWAFTRLYRSARPGLHRYACALLAGDAEAARDVVDEAFLSVWRGAGGYSGAGGADGWIRRIVRNKAVDWLRGRRERPIPAALADALPDGADTPEHAAERASAARALRRALADLSAEHREAVRLAYFEDRPLAEVARLTGCCEATVKTRLFHARRRLRAAMGG